jgi:2,5-diketo-D-gluconate reductase A
LRRLAADGDVVPAVNQIEAHPYFGNEEVRAANAEHGILTEAVIFPKSTAPARIQENFEIFDFQLGPSDIAAVSALDRGEQGRTGPNPDVFTDVSS